MASHIVGYSRMGPKIELKFALESFWDKKSSADDLQKVAADLRSSIWKQMADAGIKYIPSNTFSYHDQVLDTTSMLGAVPPRYGWNGGEIGFDTYFSMARGNASVPAMEMAKWFDTNYHYIVPELGPDVNFSYASHKAVDEYKEAKALGVNTVPVLIGPVSYLLLSKPAKGVEKTFSLLSLLPKILPIYKEVISELKAAGASWIQFDEPSLVSNLDSHQLQAFTAAYADLESTLSGLNVLIETNFADLTAEACDTLIGLKGVTAYVSDLVRGTQTIDLIKSNVPEGKYLFAGVVDGRNIWANELASFLSTLQELEAVAGKGALIDSITATSTDFTKSLSDSSSEQDTFDTTSTRAWIDSIITNVWTLPSNSSSNADTSDPTFTGASVNSTIPNFWESLSNSSSEEEICDKICDEKKIISKYKNNMQYDQIVINHMREYQDNKKIVPEEFNVEHLIYYTKSFTKKISQGGFGEVFKGWVVGPDGDIIHRLAIKRSHYLPNKNNRKQWEAEKYYLSTLRHPNIIKLIGYAENKEMYLVYEYMEHGSVSRRLKGDSTKERDVYSMGILLLQLITKRIPTPWPIKKNVISRSEIGKMSVVHEDLKDGGCNEEDDKKITSLALRCLDDNTLRRPTIEEIIEQLDQLNGNE